MRNSVAALSDGHTHMDRLFQSSVPMVQFLGGSIEQVATMLLQKRFGRPSHPADHGRSAPRTGFDREHSAGLRFQRPAR